MRQCDQDSGTTCVLDSCDYLGCLVARRARALAKENAMRAGMARTAKENRVLAVRQQIGEEMQSAGVWEQVTPLPSERHNLYDEMKAATNRFLYGIEPALMPRADGVADDTAAVQHVFWKSKYATMGPPPRPKAAHKCGVCAQVIPDNKTLCGPCASALMQSFHDATARERGQIVGPAIDAIHEQRRSGPWSQWWRW